MLLKVQHGELMAQIIYLVALLMEHYQDIVVQEQTYWLIVQWTALSIFVCLLQMMVKLAVIHLILLLLVSTHVALWYVTSPEKTGLIYVNLNTPVHIMVRS